MTEDPVLDGNLVTGEVKENWRDVGEKGSLNGSKEIFVKDPDGYLLRFNQHLGKKKIK